MQDKRRQETTLASPTGIPVVPAIELRALCKTFGTLHAVDHLTLSVQQGEIFGLLGPNGSGKTTTINLISGLATLTSGEVQVMGYQMPRHARRIRQLLGAVPQETALYEEHSAWDNLDFHADLFGMARGGKAVGFLRKRAPVSKLTIALRRVMAGERVVDPELALVALSEGNNPLTSRDVICSRPPLRG